MISPDSESKLDLILSAIEAAASASSEDSYLNSLVRILRLVVDFDFMQVIVHDETAHRTSTRLLESSFPDHSSEEEFAWDSSATIWEFATEEPLVFTSEDLELRLPRVGLRWRNSGLKSFCVLPLSTPRGRVGVLVLGRRQRDLCSPFQIRILQCVASQIAVALEGEMLRASALAYQRELQGERDHLRLLLNVNNAVVSKLQIEPMLAEVSRSMRQVIGNDYANVLIHIPEANELYQITLDCPDDVKAIHLIERVVIGDDPAGVAFRTMQPVIASRAHLMKYAKQFEILAQLLDEGVRATCSVPLIVRGRAIGVLNVMTTTKDTFALEEVDVLLEVAGQVAIALDNALAYRQISELKDKLTSEKLYLEEEIRMSLDELVGESPAWRKLLQQLEVVAGSNSTTLILGETGTGKELIARAIHNLSARKNRSFVKLNCAAIPTGLLESELFGHERGAYTGAVAQRVGRFELANHGTLLLDEVGDIPLELQPKLLRALEEQEFERLGGTRTMHVDVRLIGATNQNLQEMIAEKRFRRDLYYRLNVFPIVVPPLRERQSDIPLLARHFTQKFARKMGRKITTIPSETLRVLEQWHWPGNVRELENLIERAVLLSSGPSLNVPLSELIKDPSVVTSALEPVAPVVPKPQSLKQAERELILHALHEANGIISGSRGAAARLGVSRSSLQSKMRRLGISARRDL